MAGLLLHRGQIRVNRVSRPIVAEKAIRPSMAAAPVRRKSITSRKRKIRSKRTLRSLRQPIRKASLRRTATKRQAHRRLRGRVGGRREILQRRRLQGFNDAYDPYYDIGFAEGLEEGRQRLGLSL